VDFDLPEDDPRRVAVRAWLEEHPNASGRDLAEAGYVVPHWPKPWGVEADPLEQLIIDDELKKAGVQRPINPIGTGHCGPILLAHGTDEQRQRYIPPMLAGEEIWCQMFSEPGAGSDLASVATRAVRDGDEYVINGQKIWTSLGHFAQLGILLARTNPDAPKHEGLSYFIVDMKTPGIEVRPIVDATGGHDAASGFNEVFLTDVHIPADCLIGEENRGWQLAKETLVKERLTLSRQGAQWGWGPTATDLVEIARTAGGVTDPMLRDRLAALYIEGEIYRVHGLRMVGAAVAGRSDGTQSSVRKALGDPHGQHVFQLAKDLAGAAGMLSDSGPLGTGSGWWANGFLFSPALTVGGGTSEVLRNIIGERILGLPREPDPDAGKAWSDIARARGD
jgi:alkylation response protein AidB-like acyl-CoA dehydrogenase